MLWLGNEQRFFEIVPKYCILDSFVDYDGYSMSSKGFLYTVVNVLVIWVKFPIPVHFSSLIPRMSMFTLTISCLTTSNLPWFMDLTFQVPMQYCSLQHQTLLLLPVTSTTGCCFTLAPSLHSIWSYFSTVSSSILGTYPPGEFIFQCPVFLLFHIVHGISRQEYWSGLPFPSPADHILSDLSTMTCLSWVAPHGMVSFIELDKAVVHVIRLASCLPLCFQCVCPLMCSLSTYPLTWVYLDMGYLFTAAPAKRSCCFFPWVWGISSRLLQRCAAAAPYLGWRVSPHRCPSWPSMWDSSSRSEEHTSELQSR